MIPIIIRHSTHAVMASASAQRSDLRAVDQFFWEVPIAAHAPQQIAALFDHLIGAGEQ
jgi:hypothetical protein